MCPCENSFIYCIHYNVWHVKLQCSLLWTFCCILLQNWGLYQFVHYCFVNVHFWGLMMLSQICQCKLVIEPIESNEQKADGLELL